MKKIMFYEGGGFPTDTLKLFTTHVILIFTANRAQTSLEGQNFRGKNSNVLENKILHKIGTCNLL